MSLGEKRCQEDEQIYQNILYDNCFFNKNHQQSVAEYGETVLLPADGHQWRGIHCFIYMTQSGKEILP